MKRQNREYTVYVVELDEGGLSDEDRRRAEGTRGAVYVGYTSKTPDERLRVHQGGGQKAGRVFKRMRDPYASRLRMDVLDYLGTYPTPEEARRKERKAHNRLEFDGFLVFGDKGKKLNLSRQPMTKSATGSTRKRATKGRQSSR